MKFICKEKSGTVIRYVRQMPYDVTLAAEICQKLAGVPSMFQSFDEHPMTKMLESPQNFWLVDDVGILCLDPKPVPNVHITFWDRRLRGRESLCRDIGLLWMTMHNFEVCFTSIPPLSRAVVAFARRVGFIDLGTCNHKLLLFATPSLFMAKIQGAR